jgi:hypothetical protein
VGCDKSQWKKGGNRTVISLKRKTRNNTTETVAQGEEMVSERTFRKLVLLQSAAILTLAAQVAYAGVNVNINLGEPPRQVIVAPPPPVYLAPPTYAPPVYVPPDYAPPVEAIRVDDDVQFVYPDALGFYVAVGVPYDLVYLQNSYFLYRDGRWLRAPSSRGPWMMQRNRDLPQGLRRYRLERIREYRTREYVIYNRDRDHYRGRQLWREPRRDVRERHQEERHLEKDRRRDEHHLEKEQRKVEQRQGKEQRKDEKRAEKDDRKEEKRHDKDERHDSREGR